MKKWDNPDVIELKINSTYETPTKERFADLVDYAPDGSVEGFKQGFSESGPQMSIDSFFQ